MIRPIALVMSAALAGAFAETAPLRVALVRVTDIYAQLPATKTNIEAFDQERKEVMNDRRADEVRKLLEELKAMQATAQQKSPDDDAGRARFIEDYNKKAATMRTLQQEFETFRNERELEINRKVIAFMRQTFDQITAEARKVAVEKGFDWVIDSSGNSNTGLPVLLYSKDAPDITVDVIAAMAQQPAGNNGTPANPGPTPPSP